MRHSNLARVIAVAAAACIGATSCGSGDADAEGDCLSLYPCHRGGAAAGSRNFAYLINNAAEGTPSRMPWAGWWWAYKSNGIAKGGSSGSPAGKYDAARGVRRAQAWEAKNHGSTTPGVLSWTGHCNGWSAAAALFDEPREEKKVNGITFSVADQKALLTEVAMDVNADFFGERVDTGNDYNTPKYTDTSPDQFFLVLTNYMGLQRRAVLIDRDTGHEIWNQPMAGYKMEYPKPEDYLGAAPNAPNVYRIKLRSKIWWRDDGVDPGIITPPFTWETDVATDSRELSMELWLDAPVAFDGNGKITRSGNVIVTREGPYYVGGAWTMGDWLGQKWPDYMWIPYATMPPDPEDPYGNPHVEAAWVLNHVVKGVDDPSARPLPIEPAPEPSHSPSPHPTPSNRF
jgi:hypothetical protein